MTIDLGGGCASGGRARANCATPGNGNFEIGLSDAPATTPAFVALSAGQSPIPCASGCTLVPDLTSGLVLPAGSTDNFGSASISAPLPNDPGLVGATLFEQWLLFTGTGCFGSLALSNGIRFTIQ